MRIFSFEEILSPSFIKLNVRGNQPRHETRIRAILFVQTKAQSFFLAISGKHAL